MFEEYLEDSYELFQMAQLAAQKHDDRTARRFYRASVFYALSALEAFANYIADSFSQAGNLENCEIAFLSDKRQDFLTDKFKLIDKVEYHRIEDKLKFLIQRFKPAYDFNNKLWSDLREFKKFRDLLVHPKHDTGKITIKEYRLKLRTGITSIIGIMDVISFALFKKHLRKRIFPDLIPR
jgi:hypothetical protein